MWPDGRQLVWPDVETIQLGLGKFKLLLKHLKIADYPISKRVNDDLGRAIHPVMFFGFADNRIDLLQLHVRKFGDHRRGSAAPKHGYDLSREVFVAHGVWHLSGNKLASGFKPESSNIHCHWRNIPWRLGGAGDGEGRKADQFTGYEQRYGYPFCRPIVPASAMKALCFSFCCSTNSWSSHQNGRLAFEAFSRTGSWA